MVENIVILRDFCKLFIFADEISSVSSFCNICKSDLQNINVNLRPKLVDLLFNPFFNHDFIKIYSFLTELPLKTDEEKTEFFSLLPEKLRLFNEVAVASQLAALLLSRLVLLNKTAQKTLLPLILCPGGNGKFHSSHSFLCCTRRLQMKIMSREYFLKRFLNSM